jgi:hypothetical protein
MTTTEQQIGALQADVANVKDDMKELRSDMKEVRAILAEAKGYWRMLVIIAGFSASIGALVAKFSAWFPFPPK